MQAPTISPLPTTVVPVVPPILPPGYGVLHLQDAWFPCHLRNGVPCFIAASPLDVCPFVRCLDEEEAINFCVEEAALEHYEIQPLRNMEQYPDRIVAMEHWLFETVGRYPCWWIEGADAVGAGMYLGDEVIPAIFSTGSCLYDALITVCSMIELQQREADLRVWEDWWHETVHTR